MPSPELASVDGQISPTADARIPPADDGLLRGDGVFEVIRLYAGRPFALDEHYDRLERSAAAIELPVEREALETEVAALLEEFGEHEGQLRLVVTRGGRRLAFTEPLRGAHEIVSLASVDYTPTIILTGVKSLSYGANMHATRLAQAKGADEALLVRPDGIVLEAPTSTIFWATADGELRTPALDTGILASITRDRILGELDMVEGEFPLRTCSAQRGVPRLDGPRGPAGLGRRRSRAARDAGPRTREAAEAFAGVLEREMGSTPARG